MRIEVDALAGIGAAGNGQDRLADTIPRPPTGRVLGEMRSEELGSMTVAHRVKPNGPGTNERNRYGEPARGRRQDT